MRAIAASALVPTTRAAKFAKKPAAKKAAAKKPAAKKAAAKRPTAASHRRTAIHIRGKATASEIRSTLGISETIQRRAATAVSEADTE